MSCIVTYTSPKKIKERTGNLTLYSFKKAKKLLAKHCYNTKENRKTIYCSCSYSQDKTVDHASCGYKVFKDTRRAKKIEWEHIVPAHAFGWSFKEWREGDPKCKYTKGKKKGQTFKGRKCAEFVSTDFQRMQADMYNLHPAVGEINSHRSNFSMAEIPTTKNTKKKYGTCDIKIEGRKIEPSDRIKGLIARTYMYMDKVYPGHGIISRKNRKLFEKWDEKFPITKWECERSLIIENLQKNKNEILSSRCQNISK